MDKDVKQPLTKFQLNNEIKTSFEIGQVVPFFWRDTVPGDIFRNNTNFTVRFMPLIAPVMHKLDLQAHFYFVPYRLLDKNFRDVLAKPESPLVCKNLTELGISQDEKILDKDNLLRAFGIHSKDGTLPETAQKVTSSYFLRAYQLIYNYYFRHEILDEDYIDDMTSDDLDKYGRRLIEIGYARHGMDYFMSNLPSTQYGSMVELDMDNNGTIRVDEMRLAEKLQYFKERLLTRARGRYKNFLDTFFGVSPTNMELQQPDYLGGGSQMLDVVDVDQTATYEIEQHISPLGSQAGKVNNNKFGYNFKYRCEEHGIILGLCWILPRANYIQGVPREFIKQDFYSFYNPTFANLGMQETLGIELSAERKDTFGYNDRYAELKYAKDVIAGDFSNLSSWHFGIDLREEQLSEEFVKVHTDNQPFAVRVSSDIIEFNSTNYTPVSFIGKSPDVIFFSFVPNSIIEKDNAELEATRAYFKRIFDPEANSPSNLPNSIYESVIKKNTVAYKYPSGGIGNVSISRNDVDADRPFVYYSPSTMIYLRSVIPGLSELKAPFAFFKYDSNGSLYLAAPDTIESKVKFDLSKITSEYYSFNHFMISTQGPVIGNHILVAAFNQCDALRPIPKLAKPSISL